MKCRREVKILIALLCIIGFTAGALGFLQSMSVARMRASSHRFAFIRSRLFEYVGRNGAFPPTKYQSRADGPLHSWRVLLIVEEMRLKQYDFTKPWDSPQNRQALGRHANRAIRFAGLDTRNGSSAHYLAIGDDDGWPARRYEPLLSLLLDEEEGRFLMVEYPRSDIHWMEPRY